MLSLRDLALLPAKLVYTFACWPLLRLPVYYTTRLKRYLYDIRVGVLRGDPRYIYRS